jgi:hypothetical protein
MTWNVLFVTGNKIPQMRKFKRTLTAPTSVKLQDAKARAKQDHNTYHLRMRLKLHRTRFMSPLRLGWLKYIIFPARLVQPALIKCRPLVKSAVFCRSYAP